MESNPQNNTPPKPNRVIRIFKKIILTCIALFMLLFVAGFLIGYIYQDDVKEYIINELNKNLNTQVIVDGKDIDFSVFKNFPAASVDFKNVKALDAIKIEKKDTLFKAGEISFQFNLMDIFKKNYTIKHIAFKDVSLKLKVDKNGNDNYHFWKKSADTTSANFSFALKTIDLKNIRIDYKNSQSNIFINTQIKKSTLSGEFSNEKYLMDVDANMFVKNFESDNTVFLNEKQAHIKLALDVDVKSETYKIKNGKLTIENLLFEIFGNVVFANKNPIINISIKGKEMNIQSVLSLVPAKFKNKINDYSSTGEFYFNSTFEGTISGNNELKTKADFGIKNADIKNDKNNITLRNVNLKGHYQNGKDEVFELTNFSALLNNGNINGNLSIKKDIFLGSLKSNSTLEEINQLLHIDTLEIFSGGIKIDAEFSGLVSDYENKQFRNIQTSGDLSIDNAKIKLKNNSLLTDSLTGNFKFNNNDLIVNDLKGRIAESDFLLQGFFRNIFGYLMENNQRLSIEATLNSKNVNLNKLLADNSEQKNKSKYKLQFSDLIDANLNTEISHLVFRKFDATNIKGIVKLKNKKMILDPITLSTMNGSISTSGEVDGTDSTQLVVHCFSDVNKINVTKMFYSFENFGQQSVTDKNIKGIASAKIQFAAVLSNELIIDMDKLYAAADMAVQNGELNNVEAMKSLSKFIELKELENIKFSTLKNQIEVKKQVVSIPKMEVKSSALNVFISGTHNFKNEINYKVKLSLNELLAKKAIKAKKENEEFGEVADDGLGKRNIFLSMTGTLDNPKIKYDSKGAVQNVKEDLKVEKQNLKSILKEEFGLFKKDTTVAEKYKNKEDENAKFNVNWENQKNTESDKKKTIKAPKKQEEEDY